MRKELLLALGSFVAAALVSMLALAFRAKPAKEKVYSSYAEIQAEAQISIAKAAWNQAYWTKRAALAAEGCKCPK